MEIFKNIFFNTDKLKNYSKVKITYAGKLFKEESNNVFLHYSFNNNWNNASDIKMKKSDLGFQAEIELNNNNTLNICFFNEKNDWDNNNYTNYNFEIEKAELSLAAIENSLLTNKHLSKFYLWKKRIRFNFLKIIKFITGNYKRKISNKNPLA